MKVSVIVPTYNGANKLPFILDALSKQTYKQFEIIIAIDGSVDNSLEVAKSYSTNFSCFSIVQQANKGRASIRNFGAQNSNGSLLVFFDDDMCPSPSCLQEHIAHHEEFLGSILTGAQMDIDEKGRKDVQQFKATLSRKWFEPLKKYLGKPLPKENLFLTAANFSVSKELFNLLSGFDEQLSDAEDFDLAARAYEAGIPLYFNYNAFAWHDDAITAVSYIKRQRQYAIAFKELRQLKPWLKTKGYINLSTSSIGLKRIVFLFFTFRIWINAIDKQSLNFLPKTIRYKLYDWIITANGVIYPEKIAL
jgi:glycosyltransferase involved in cell wall biosynthesis